MTDQPAPTEPTAAAQTSPVWPDECCARCVHFMAGPTAELPSFCRRFPPTPFLVNVKIDEKTGQVTSNQQISTQPVVNPAGKCGEFKRRQEDVH